MMQRRILASLVLGVLASQTVLAAPNWNITGAGARAEGMAGAFTGVADDATSIVWNPAGLATLVRPEASLVMRSIANKTEYDWANDLNAIGVPDEEVTDSHALLNFLSAAYPFEVGGRKIVAGLALQSQLDGYGEEVDNNNPGYSDKSEGGVSTITPGFGVQLTPLLSLGMAVNVWTGTIDGDVVDPTGQDYTYELKASGLNFGAGALLDFSTLAAPLPLKLGINLRTPFDLDLDYSDTIPFSPTTTTTVEMPLMLSVGVAWQAGELFTIALDAESRQYGGSKIKNEGVADVPLANHEKDLLEIRLGAEYLFVTDFAVVPLRVGVRTVPTLDADYSYDSVTDTESYDQVTGFGFAIGTGLIFEQMAFDLAFSSSNYENTGTVDGSEFLTATNTTSKLTLSGIFYF